MKKAEILYTLLLLIAFGYANVCAASHGPKTPKVIQVRAGDADDFLKALQKVNKTNAAPDAPRTYIYLPMGTYDLGRRVLNKLSAHNVSIVGQNMNATVIRNAPDVKDEGISKTATLLITGENTYLQDLTIENAMRFYEAGFAGRAVCIQDLGTHTICKRVKLLSHQDTYYTKNAQGEYYWEDSEIHGTVDFVCGRGDVYFQNCRIVVEKRNADGTGRCVIAAPHTSKTFGLMFHDCTIDNLTEEYSLARSWGGRACCYYVNTTLSDPRRIMPSRFTRQGMNVVPTAFIECNTKDLRGVMAAPESNVQTFFKDSICRTLETIEPPTAAGRYTVERLLPQWRPDTLVTHLENQAKRVLAALHLGASLPQAATADRRHYAIDGTLPLSYEKMKATLGYPLSWRHYQANGFEQWKAAGRKAFADCIAPMPPRADFQAERLESEQRQGYRVDKILFNISAYDRVPAYVLTPTVGEGPYPAIVMLHDHGATFNIGKEKNVRPMASEGDRLISDYTNKRDERGRRRKSSIRLMDKCNQWAAACYDSVYVGDYLAQHGYVVICVDELYWGERSRRQGADYDYMEPLAGSLVQLGYTLSGIAVHDDVATTDFIATLPQVDATRIGTLGFSMGANRAWKLAAMSDKIKAGAAVCWMCTTDSLITPRNNQTRSGGWPMNVDRLANYMDLPDVAALACPKPMLFFNGADDKLFPVEGVKESYRVMREVYDSQQAGDKLVTRIWPGKHFFSKAMQAEVLKFFNRALSNLAK